MTVHEHVGADGQRGPEQGGHLGLALAVVHQQGVRDPVGRGHALHQGLDQLRERHGDRAVRQLGGRAVDEQGQAVGGHRAGLDTARGHGVHHGGGLGAGGLGGGCNRLHGLGDVPGRQIAAAQGDDTATQVDQGAVGVRGGQLQVGLGHALGVQGLAGHHARCCCCQLAPGRAAGCGVQGLGQCLVLLGGLDGAGTQGLLHPAGGVCGGGGVFLDHGHGGRGLRWVDAQRGDRCGGLGQGCAERLQEVLRDRAPGGAVLGIGQGAGQAGGLLGRGLGCCEGLGGHECAEVGHVLFLTECGGWVGDSGERGLGRVGLTEDQAGLRVGTPAERAACGVRGCHVAHDGGAGGQGAHLCGLGHKVGPPQGVHGVQGESGRHPGGLGLPLGLDLDVGHLDGVQTKGAHGEQGIGDHLQVRGQRLRGGAVLADVAAGLVVDHLAGLQHVYEAQERRGDVVANPDTVLHQGVLRGHPGGQVAHQGLDQLHQGLDLGRDVGRLWLAKGPRLQDIVDTGAKALACGGLGARETGALLQPPLALAQIKDLELAGADMF